METENKVHFRPNVNRYMYISYIFKFSISFVRVCILNEMTSGIEKMSAQEQHISLISTLIQFKITRIIKTNFDFYPVCLSVRAEKQNYH